jgi:hypothetical protein
LLPSPEVASNQALIAALKQLSAAYLATGGKESCRNRKGVALVAEATVGKGTINDN